MKYEELKTLLEERKSVHNFIAGGSISPEDFYRILELARLAPSGYNAQPWRAVLVASPGKLKEICAAAFNQKQVIAAGSAVVILGNREFMKTEKTRMIKEAKENNLTKSQIENLQKSFEKERSVTQKNMMTVRSSMLFAMSFILSAQSLGFATCPMMGFDHQKLLKATNAKESEIPVLLIAIGQKDPEKPEKIYPRKEAKDLGEII